jgi:2'-5' RNA ligase
VGAFTITDFALMQSILHPTGPVYKVIERFDLRGQASQ